MNVTFYGAVREVTGSMHMLSTGTDSILLDCGLFQGRRKETAEKNRRLPFDPRSINHIVLSHAHIDHSGRIPLITKNGFNGRIVATRATVDACGCLLPDSAHIQESDADYLNYKKARSALNQQHQNSGKKKRKRSDTAGSLKRDGHKLDKERIEETLRQKGIDPIEPLYTSLDAEQALECFDGIPYRHTVTIGGGVDCTLYEAGHILGSAISMINVQDNGKPVNICYTGDIGRYDKPIIKDPALEFEAPHRTVDLMIMESTYGDRIHDPVADLKPSLQKVLLDSHDRGGAVIIPSFAYGRTQDLLYVLHELYDEGKVPRIPVFVDSPLATRITQVFGEHPEVYDHETHAAFLEKGRNPFAFEQVHFVGSVEESMALNRDEKPHIVISASGMCEAGRILHHLRHKIHNPKHTILLVGYMAQHTLGRRILEKGLAYEQSGRKGNPPLVKFMNKEYPLKARVVKLDGFSAHGDREELLSFLKQSNLTVKRIAVVHGEEDQSLAFAQFLKSNGYDAFVPTPGQKIDI